MTSELRPAGKTILSCGHEDVDGCLGVSVQFDDEDCVAGEGFIPVTVYAQYCHDCAKTLYYELGKDAGSNAAELAKFKALAETLAGALEQYDQGCAAIGGCSDGYCVIQRPKGMHTNGGCRCSDDRNRMRRFASRAAYFREKVAEALRQYKEARDD